MGMNLQSRIEAVLQDNMDSDAYFNAEAAAKDILQLFAEDREALAKKLKGEEIHVRNCECMQRSLSLPCYRRNQAFRAIIRETPL